MSQANIERRLLDIAKRLRAARQELAVMAEQHEVLAEAAEDARIRSLVSETPLAHKEYTEAQRHADAMARTMRSVEGQIEGLVQTQDQLLDKLLAPER